MKGLEQYTQKNLKMVNSLINKNEDKPYLTGFMVHLQMNKSELTTYNYLRHIIDFMNSIDNKELNKINYNDYIIYENKFVNATSSYRIVKHSALKAFSSYLFISKLSNVDVLEDAKAPRACTSVETIERRENNYLNKDETEKYLATIKEGIGSHKAKERQKEWKSRDIAIVTTLLNTGMRCSALYKLDVDDINFDTKEIKVKEKGKIQMYYLNDHVCDALKNWLQDRRKYVNNEPALFISNQRRRLSLKAISNITEKYGKPVKDIHLTPHKLRATFGTQVYAASGDLYLTKEAMGHSNTSTTEIYIRGQHKESKIKAAQYMQSFID